MKAFVSILVLVFSVSALADDNAPGLVRLVTRNKSKAVIIGEVGRRNETHIEVFDLKDGQPSIFKINELISIQEQVSEYLAIQTVGLPKYLAWRIKQSIPTGSAIGRIAKIDGDNVYITLGTDNHIVPGRELLVIRGEEELKDPATGEVIGKQRRQVGKLMVSVVMDKRLSMTKLVGELESPLEVGDVVETIVPKDSVALLPLVNLDGNETQEGKALIEELTTIFVSRGVSVVDRKHLESVLNELNLQQTKEFDPEKAQKVGKQIGAATILTGTIVPRGRYATAQLRLIRVDTGEIVCAVPYRLPGTTTTASSSSSKATTTTPKVTEPEPALAEGEERWKNKAFKFADPEEVEKDWIVGTGKERQWRIEGDGIKMFEKDQRLESRQKFRGDITITVAGKFSTENSFIQIFGESFRIKQGERIVSLMRKGDTLQFSDGSPPITVKLKKEQLESVTSIAIWHADARYPTLIKGVIVTGIVVAPDAPDLR